MGSESDYTVELQSTNYDDLKAVSDDIAQKLSQRPELTKVHSSLENAASVVKVTVNPIKARAAGLSPAQIGGTLNNMLSGVTPTTMNINGDDIDVKVEYPKDRYRSLDQVESVTLQTPSGRSVALTDVADIRFADSPASITRQDKQYRVTAVSYTHLRSWSCACLTGPQGMCDLPEAANCCSGGGRIFLRK